MKSIRQKVLSGLLALLMLAGSTGCTQENSGESSATAAMGRYIETERTMPTQDFSQILHFSQQDDGSLLLIAQLLNRENLSSGSLYAWRSTDGAATWQEEEFPLGRYLDDFEEVSSVTGLALAPDGTPYVSLWIESEFEDDPALESEEDTVDSSLPEEIAPEEPEDLPKPDDGPAGEPLPELTTNQIYRFENGGLEMVSIPVTNVADMKFMPNGHLIVNDYVNLNIYDLSTGESKAALNSGMLLAPSFYYADNDTLVLLSADAINLYQTEDYKKTQSIPLAGALPQNPYRHTASTVLAPDTEDGAFFYANTSGLYRVIPDGDLTERLVDGSMNSMCSPSFSMNSLVPLADDSFLVLMESEDFSGTQKLLHYQYDPQTVAVPDTELVVYALEDVPIVREAITQFQRQYPQVKVTLETALSAEDTALEKGDVLAELNTRMLADDGPDILVLDELPIDRFVQNGFLADISGLVLPETLEGMQNNILDVFENKYESMAIPARYSVPMVFGYEELVESCTDIETFAATMKEQDNPMIGVSPLMIMERFYPVCQDRWLESDGSLNKAVLEQDMKDLYALVERYHGKEILDADDATLLNCGMVSAGLLDISPLVVQSVRELSGPYTVQKELPETRLSVLPMGSSGIFYPEVLLGVNESSAQKELACQFIDCVLSFPVQSSVTDGGLPVNTAAWKEKQTFPLEGAFDAETVPIETWGGGGINPFDNNRDIEVFFSAYWPNAGYFDEMETLLEGLDTPVVVNTALKDIFVTSTRSYWSGRKSLDECLSALYAKVDIYLSENQW